jgi:hypothetical protein
MRRDFAPIAELMMRTAVLPLAFALSLLTACGDDDGEAPPEARPHNVETRSVSGGLDDVPVDEVACRAFCEKSNECASASGRTVPPDARDCARSCGPGGVHRQAPEAIHVCASEECGQAFITCARQAMLAQMQDRDIAIFPPICQGLCAKSARCHRQAGLPENPGEDDCEAACEPGGAYAEVPEQEFLCVHQPCGAPFAECRRDGVPRAPAETAPGAGTNSP